MIEIDGMKAFTLVEVAKILKLTVRSLREYIKTGRLKANKIGNVYYIKEDDIKKIFD